MNLEPVRELIALATTLRDQIDGGDGAYPDESFDVCNRTLDSIPALSQLLEAVTWQPIETAPKGNVLLYTQASKDRNPLPAIVRIGYKGDWPFRETTHWMPLPSPPEDK